MKKTNLKLCLLAGSALAIGAVFASPALSAMAQDADIAEDWDESDEFSDEEMDAEFEDGDLNLEESDTFDVDEDDEFGSDDDEAFDLDDGGDLEDEFSADDSADVGEDDANMDTDNGEGGVDETAEADATPIELSDDDGGSRNVKPPPE